MTAQRPRGTKGYRRCEFTVRGIRCANQACWEMAECYLCWKHVRLIQSETRIKYAPPVRIATPKRGR